MPVLLSMKRNAKIWARVTEGDDKKKCRENEILFKFLKSNPDIDYYI